ncbi:hypothetical protein [Rhizobium azibense]|uniref:Tripartite tricarboxylate transporter TctA family protein n=1 Tax=Rhizobium azibense TaxID=1136135 RepID=A0A4V2VDB6_9HYPH|nr:hypothetical protein [Rhizobium azibense]TCU31795.1 hypothetical protein EV129_12428 [Rhizobium azibense]
MLLAFILGPMMEEFLRRTLLFSKGGPSVFLTRPLSAVLLGIAAILLVLVVLPAVRRLRDEAFHEE